MNNKKNKPWTFKGRRNRNVVITVLMLAILGVFVWAQNRNLQHSSFSTGYVLIASLFFLATFNLRKKLPFLPAIGSASFWMQLHIYVGLSTFVMFAFHIGWKIPNGLFEGTLAFLYLFVALSGVYGLYITRVLPKRLTDIKEEVIYERIPGFRKQIANQTRQLVLQACESTDVLATFYANKLAAFFERPRSFAYRVSPSGRRRRQLMSEIQDLNRYLADDQRVVSGRLSELVQKKDDLDYHAAIQGRLKLWMFIHVGFTYSLLIFAVVHGFMAHAFSGGLK